MSARLRLVRNQILIPNLLGHSAGPRVRRGNEVRVDEKGRDVLRRASRRVVLRFQRDRIPEHVHDSDRALGVGRGLQFSADGRRVLTSVECKQFGAKGARKQVSARFAAPLGRPAGRERPRPLLFPIVGDEPKPAPRQLGSEAFRVPLRACRPLSPLNVRICGSRSNCTSNKTFLHVFPLPHLEMS